MIYAIEVEMVYSEQAQHLIPKNEANNKIPYLQTNFNPVA